MTTGEYVKSCPRHVLPSVAAFFSIARSSQHAPSKLSSPDGNRDHAFYLCTESAEAQVKETLVTWSIRNLHDRFVCVIRKAPRSLYQCFLTFFSLVHPCHRLLHSHSPYCNACPMWQTHNKNQWHMAVIIAGCALFVTSHCGVKFTFQIQRCGEVF